MKFRRTPNTAFVLPEGMALGGATTWSIEMCNLLVARDAPATLIEHAIATKPLDRSEFDPRVGVATVRATHPLNARPPDVPRYVPAYRSVLPALVVPNWAQGTYAACAALMRRSRSDLRVLGVAHTDEAHYYDLMRYYDPILHGIVAVSEEIAARLRQELPHRAGQILVRSCPVHVPPRLNRTYSDPGRPLQLVYAGRLEEKQKRVFRLLDLAGELSALGVDFQLRILGSGVDRQNFLDRLARLDPRVAARIRMEGQVPYARMPEIWRSADACVLVSEFEGTSLSMLEAMAGGCVPVVLRVSGVSGVLRQGKNGFVLPQSGVSGMAEVLAALAAQRGQLPALGREAYRTALDGYSYEAYLKWFLGLTEQLWREKPRRWPWRRPVLDPATLPPPASPEPRKKRPKRQRRKLLPAARDLALRTVWNTVRVLKGKPIRRE